MAPFLLLLRTSFMRRVFTAGCCVHCAQMAGTALMANSCPMVSALDPLS
jgi:hypothetical protein